MLDIIHRLLALGRVAIVPGFGYTGVAESNGIPQST